MRKNKRNQYLPVTQLINPFELLELVNLHQNGFISEDDLLTAIGYDIPQADTLPEHFINPQLISLIEG